MIYINIKRVYNLPTIDTDQDYTPEWYAHAAFFDFCGEEVDEERFNWQDAVEDTRIAIHLKAYHDFDNSRLEYWAVEFDGKYIGLVVGVDEPMWFETQDRYITNYPSYQTMVAYIKAMYVGKPERVVGETTKLDDLDGRYGSFIDKRYSNNMRKEEK